MGKSTSTVSFSIKVDASKIDELAAHIKAFDAVLDSTMNKLDDTRKRVINFAAVATGIDQAQDALQQLQGTLSGMVAAYSESVVAETKLTEVMRQRMAATDAEIESIKALAAEQQKLGIIDDDTQLAGAQQVATFLTQKSSIETLLPAMNNLIAQQKGLAATGQDAVTVANLVGKAMHGQTSALTRVGIVFSEAEAEALKYGDEASRAATLAQIITNNVGNMNAELAKTDTGKQKQLENTLGDIQEQIGGLAQGAMPLITLGTAAMMAFGSVFKLWAGIKGTVIAVKGWVIASKAAVVSTSAFGWVASKTAVIGRVLALSLHSSAMRAIALKLALRGLLMATGAGIAIAALTFVLEKLTNAFDDTKNAAGEAADGIDEAQDAAGRSAKAFEQTNAETYSGLMTKYQELRSQWAALSDEHSRAKWVRHNATAFAELGLKIYGVKDAEAAFSGNTDNVVAAFTARAKAAARLAELTELYRRQMELTDRISTADTNAQRGAAGIPRVKAGQHIPLGKRGEVSQYAGFLGRHSKEDGLFTPKRYGGRITGYVFTEKGAALYNSEIGKDNSQEYKNDKAELVALNKQIARVSTQVKEDAKANTSVTFDKDKPTSKGGKIDKKDGNANKIIDNAKSYEQLSHNLGVYKKRLEAADPANTALVESLRKQIAVTEAAAQAAKDLAEGVNTTDPKTLEEVDVALGRVQDKIRKATRENIAAYQAEEEKLQALKKALEGAGYTPSPVESITSYEALSKAVSYYEDVLKTADATTHKAITAQIHELEKLKAKWDEARKVIEKPADISQLNTTEQLSKAVSYYRDLQAKTGADEVAQIEDTIKALERKEAALKRGVDIYSWQQEAAEVNALSGQEYKIKVRSYGFEELTEKIKGLNKLLADTENPVTTQQRKDIQSLIKTYEDWRRTGVHSFETFVSGWDNLKGVGGSIDAMSNALSSNANAWQAITGIVDAAIQIYQGIMGVVSFINMLTSASNAKAGAEMASASATATNVAAQGAQAAAAPAVVLANKAIAKSILSVAAAEYMAAHAAIPFAGFGIGSGFATSAAGVVASMAAVPFAKGGIVSGPTFALVGEYAGAANNPEVIAPLDKLRSMIQPSGGVGGNVRFEIEGRKLVGVISNETRISSKSGRRSNIKV